MGGRLAFICKTTNDQFYGKGTHLEEDMFDNEGHIRHFFSEDYTRSSLVGYRIERKEVGYKAEHSGGGEQYPLVVLRVGLLLPGWLPRSLVDGGHGFILSNNSLTNGTLFHIILSEHRSTLPLYHRDGWQSHRGPLRRHCSGHESVQPDERRA